MTKAETKMRRSTTAGAILMVMGMIPVSEVAICADPPASVEAAVQTVEGDWIRGVISRFSTERGVVLQTRDGERKEIPVDRIVRVRLGSGPVEPPRRGMRVTLVTGDRLYGNPVEAEAEEALTLETSDLGRVTVPLEAVARLERIERGRRTNGREAWFRRLPQGEDDLILLANGDVLRGYV
ncbi:MAG: hypothetical protein D6788_10850, partial [Planctomycetota bacterium]